MTRKGEPIPLPPGAYLVPAPRVTDVAAQSLRSAFANAPRLPEDMMALLSMLDRMGRS